MMRHSLHMEADHFAHQKITLFNIESPRYFRSANRATIQSGIAKTL
jgi:hypothetical protein